MTDTAELVTDATTILADLVAFDTTSRNSNLALIAYVEDLLRPLGVSPVRVPDPTGAKANLYATIGPNVPGGLVLSGHTDVVPVDGQAWSSDPFTLTRRGDRFFGRGTCDMKGFVALALALVRRSADRPLARPLHLALSYDEEVGCVGAPAMIERLAATLPPPAAVIVGEPTNMEAVHGHKGIATWTVTVTGHEAHSSLTHLGVSANMVAIDLMATLKAIADRLAREAGPDSGFCPPHSTLTIGQIQGGTAVNILAGECRFSFDLRTTPDQDPAVLIAPFEQACHEADASLKQRFPGTGVELTRRSATPSFAPDPDGPAERLVRALAGDNGPGRVVAYAAEAGQFQRAGFSTVICGPGSIEQAHQPDEWLAVNQLERGAAFMLRTEDWLLSGM